tara:strand:- start:107 stop:598 length:492 start_codon:yes stop_codon:yes gene_type:complete
MKKTQLRKIIKESIKELMNEQSTGYICQDGNCLDCSNPQYNQYCNGTQGATPGQYPNLAACQAGLTANNGSCPSAPPPAPSSCPGCNGGNHVWGGLQNWQNTFDALGPFNSTNPNQPCNFLQQRIAQWTSMQSGITNQCNAFWNQLECKIKHSIVLKQHSNCN